MKYTLTDTRLAGTSHSSIPDLIYLDLEIEGGGSISGYVPTKIAALVKAAPALMEVLGDLEMLFDEQTYDEIKKAEFDPPDDREFAVNITSKQLRAISAVLLKAGA